MTTCALWAPYQSRMERGSWNACAARMYVHVNTVRYRIRRIEELTGRDLSCLDDQVDFFLALRIR